jgi:chromosome segregation ATPase
MVSQNLKRPIDTLLTEKNKLDNKKTTLNDLHIRYTTELQQLRNDQNSYRTAKESMSNTVSNRAARKVFDDQIAQLQLRVNEVLKELDKITKDNEVVESQVKAMAKSIKELQAS